MGVGKCGCVLLKKISKVDNLQDDLFAFKINYEDPENSVALFNGNISETYWKTASDNLKRKYSYQYDDLNRLHEGNYSREGGNFKNSYLETMNYDKNGNIQTMYRNGDNDDVNYEFTIDNLFYTYDRENKNLLKKVFDASNSPQGFKDDSDGFDDPEDDYEYDANGNLTKDANKKIQNITYNHLNLPVHIVFETGEITYLYNATGQKLQKSVEGSDSITTDYLTGFQYHNEALNHFEHAEGYVRVVNNRFKYVFNYIDHLGNIRLSYSDANDNNIISENEILEENHYYPFGLKHSAYNTQHQGYIHQEELDKFILLQMPKFAGDGSYNYKYNGKEYQDELGLNMYDYGARNYDAALGRWMNVDPLAEKMRRFSPYNYCFNNPLRFTDPDGMEGQDWVKKGSKIFYDSEIKSQEQANAKYGETATHLPECSTTTGTINGEIAYQYTFNNDGTVSDMEGNILSKTSNIDTAGGTTIIGSENKSGFKFSFGLNASIGGGWGVDIGVIKDSGGDVSLFASSNINVGLGADVGFSFGPITSTHSGPFLAEDVPGESLSLSSGIQTPVGGIGGSYGGTFSNSLTSGQRFNPANYGTSDTGRGNVEFSRGYIQGPSAKLSAAFMYRRSNTVSLNIGK